jgi:malonate-semialdehyde dehydrogenase (acetylating)/methylmalonate-semialdehyde dehydrogenase
MPLRHIFDIHAHALNTGLTSLDTLEYSATHFVISVLFQMFPVAIVCGNTYVIKPSERDPGACMMLIKMAQDAGVPDGVLNVIHGARDCKCMKT